MIKRPRAKTEIALIHHHSNNTNYKQRHNHLLYFVGINIIFVSE